MKPIALSAALLFACQAFSETPDEARFRAQLEEKPYLSSSPKDAMAALQQIQAVVVEMKTGKVNIPHATTMQQSLSNLTPSTAAAVLAALVTDAYNQGKNEGLKQVGGAR